MKTYLLLTLILFGSFSIVRKAENEESRKQFENTITIPLGGNTYQTAGNTKEKITQDGIISWTNSDTEYSIYFKSSSQKEVSLFLVLSEQKQASQISISSDNAVILDIEPNQSGVLEIGNLNLKPSYNEIKLKGIRKDGQDFAKIRELLITYDGDLSLDFVKDNEDNRFYWGRRGPSVHLTYTLPDQQDFKWFYNEVTVPVGLDPIGSYFMANGFGEGYFGIQVNSESERRILFSVWSPFKTDNPGEIPEEEKIKLLKKGADVYTGEFGNEGSGGQSYLRYPWKAGETYRFLNSVEPDGNGNTIYTAYFLDPEIGEWMLIASFLRPKTDTWYKRPHSFLENFNPDYGNITRKAFYINQWARTTDGSWVELTEARFTGDDIANRGYRLDFAGGAEDGVFYLQNGGFFDAAIPLKSMHDRKPINSPPVIDFTKLP